LAALNF